MGGERRWSFWRRQQAVVSVTNKGGHPSNVSRDHRQAARERFHDRQRHVVDVGTLDIEVVVGEERRHGVRLDSADERHAPQVEVGRQAAEPRSIRPVPANVSVASGYRACTSLNARSVQATL